MNPWEQQQYQFTPSTTHTPQNIDGRTKFSVDGQSELIAARREQARLNFGINLFEAISAPTRIAGRAISEVAEDVIDIGAGTMMRPYESSSSAYGPTGMYIGNRWIEDNSLPKPDKVQSAGIWLHEKNKEMKAYAEDLFHTRGPETIIADVFKTAQIVADTPDSLLSFSPSAADIFSVMGISAFASTADTNYQYWKGEQETPFKNLAKRTVGDIGNAANEISKDLFNVDFIPIAKDMAASLTEKAMKWGRNGQ